MAEVINMIKLGGSTTLNTSNHSKLLNTFGKNKHNINLGSSSKLSIDLKIT